MVVQVGDKVRVTWEGEVVSKGRNGYFQMDCASQARPGFYFNQPSLNGRKVEILESPWRVGDVLRISGSTLHREYDILFADDKGYLIRQKNDHNNTYFFPKAHSHYYEKVKP